MARVTRRRVISYSVRLWPPYKKTITLAVADGDETVRMSFNPDHLFWRAPMPQKSGRHESTIWVEAAYSDFDSVYEVLHREETVFVEWDDSARNVVIQAGTSDASEDEEAAFDEEAAVDELTRLVARAAMREGAGGVYSYTPDVSALFRSGGGTGPAEHAPLSDTVLGALLRRLGPT